ncbi:DNA oxidative demethylase ALKBH2 [Ixodes scapularis]|uniref:DNA oxidative demethylase ALKBH2 n=1 Tax=Ixodes scapularis TaxID=6945 RepID=UPI001A9D7E2D|nr:DNA oxidative demethylase ALKBH2 [Ixodes scapularis]
MEATDEESDALLEKVRPNSASMTAKKILKEDLDLHYTNFFARSTADYILERLEKEVEYFTGELLKIQVYGKWHSIPRKQVSYGDPGTSYRFSGTCLPAKQWTPLLLRLRDLVSQFAGHHFNFVLINRYNDGSDHIGEHRDNEKDLDQSAPIASLSFGQARDFVLKHGDARRKVRHVDPVKISLEHGSLLLMNSPTNQYWYHSLPPRKSALSVRVNLTFRCLLTGT